MGGSQRKITQLGNAGLKQVWAKPSQREVPAGSPCNLMAGRQGEGGIFSHLGSLNAVQWWKAESFSCLLGSWEIESRGKYSKLPSLCSNRTINVGCK